MYGVIFWFVFWGGLALAGVGTVLGLKAVSDGISHRW